MKLSEMSTRKAAACMAELAAPIGKLAKHPAVKEFIKQKGNEEINAEMAIDLLVQALPVFLRDNFDDTVKVVAVLTEKTPAAVSEQPIKTTIEDVKGCIDGDLVGFFR